MKTLRLFIFHAICLTVSFLLLSATTEAKKTSPMKEEKFHTVVRPHLVWFADGHLTVRVQDVPLGELLDEIAGKSGLTVVRYVASEQKLTIEFDRLPLEEGLRRILRHRSFVLEYAQPTSSARPSAGSRPKTLSILPQEREEYFAQRVLVPQIRGGSSGEEGTARILGLQATLASGSAEAREEAATALGESGQAEAVTPLTLALADTKQDVREAAVVSLAEVGGAEAVQALAIALRDKDPRVREEAVDALGEIGGEIAVGLLQQALVDEVEYVREAAAEILEELKDRKQ